MAKKETLQRHAEEMFIDLGYNAKLISERLDVTEKTVGLWRKKGDWDKRRDELFASPHKLREILLKEMRWVADGNPPRFDTDALSKINKVFTDFGNKISPQVVMAVLKLVDEWSANIDPELTNKNLDLHKRFILHMINLHG